jgi:uncharacterized membrane-anchored protein YjiN (DUF445 family)
VGPYSKFLEQVSHVQELYPKTVVAEDILRKYIKEGLEKDEARMPSEGEILGKHIKESLEGLEKDEAKMKPKP